MNFLEQYQELVFTYPWLGHMLRAGILIGIGYGGYRMLMGRAAGALRGKLPFLDLLHHHQEVKRLIKKKEYAQAGEALLRRGQSKKAIEIFTKGRLFSRAADIYASKLDHFKAAKLYEKAGELEKAADIYILRKKFDRAEEVYAKMGKVEQLGQIYEAKEEYFEAAKLFMRFDRYARAAQSFEKAGNRAQAAENYEKAFVLEKKSIEKDLQRERIPSDILSYAKQAIVLYSQLEQWDDAGRLQLQIEDYSGAADSFAMNGDHRKAAELAEQAQDLEKAAQYWDKAGDKKMAAKKMGQHQVRHGEYLHAVEKYKEAGDFSAAAELLRDMMDLDGAAKMHALAGEHDMAAMAYEDLGKHGLAGEHYEKAENWASALTAYQKSKLFDKELSILRRLGDLIGTGRHYYKRKMYGEALEELKNISQDDSRYKSALAIKGRIFMDQEKYSESKNCFEHSIGLVETLDEEDLDTLYQLALVGERTSISIKPLEFLEQRLAQDLVENQAREKANTIRKILNERAYSKMTQLIQGTHSGSRVLSLSRVLTDIKDHVSGLTRSKTKEEKRYELIKEIGRGGMGVVYLAKDLKLDRELALKVLPSTKHKDKRTIETFLREAKAAASLNHPNIVTVHDSGVQDGSYFIAMERIDGKTIKTILKKRGRFSPTVTLELLRQLLSALGYAHENKVVHRDLTTSNMMWTRQKFLKIMDFGLAKIIRELQSEQSIIGGTPSFMSPEQTLGKPFDHRTDIYSLGICVFEMLLGVLPFSKGDLGYHHLHTPPPVAKDIDAKVPSILSDMIGKCMEKKPDDRFQNVEEIQKFLRIR
ncbi:MAG: protein kinase [Bdellovibrionales bacterium]|nr:protein kinase [Bdellovibrionales bacterium]